MKAKKLGFPSESQQWLSWLYDLYQPDNALLNYKNLSQQYLVPYFIIGYFESLNIKSNELATLQETMDNIFITQNQAARVRFCLKSISPEYENFLNGILNNIGLKKTIFFIVEGIY